MLAAGVFQSSAKSTRGRYTPAVISLLALLCWIGGLALMQVSLWAGSGLAALGFVAAGIALRRKDDLETMFGLFLLFVLGVTAVRLLLWLWSLFT